MSKGDDLEIKEPEVLVKELKLYKTKKNQHMLIIPSDIVNALELEKGDQFIFRVPLKDKKEYSIKLNKKIK